MLDLLPTPPALLAFRVRGDMPRGALARVDGIIERKLLRVDHLSLFLEIECLGVVPASAMLDDLRFGLRHHARFTRVATVSDPSWAAACARIDAAMWPRARVEHFGLGQRLDALRWLLREPSR